MAEQSVQRIQTEGIGDLRKPVVAYFEDHGRGEGMVTLVCNGSAWNTTFTCMSDGETMAGSIADTDTKRLVRAFGTAYFMREFFLVLAIEAVKSELRVIAQQGGRV